MNRPILFTLVIVFAAHFEEIGAFFDWIDLTERLFFRTTSLVYPSVFIDNDQAAQAKFIEDEQYRKEKPFKMKHEIYELENEIMKWKQRHDETYFFLRWLVRWIVDYYERKREVLVNKRVEAVDARDLEPFCHNRFHRYGEREALDDCRKAFQHRFFKSKNWILRDSNDFNCAHISVRRVEDPHGENSRISSNREARTCSAKTAIGDQQIKFNVYLIAGRAFIERDRFAYYVLLNEDTRTNSMKPGRFWHPLEEKKAQVAAYIES